MRTNFWVIACSRPETLFSAMNITIAINTNREIEISIAIHVLHFSASPKTVTIKLSL